MTAERTTASARSRIAGGCLLALASVVAACGSSSGSSRCGTSYVTDVYWGEPGLGGWYVTGGVAGVGYDGDWYDPGDTYDPSVDPGDDGSGWDVGDVPDDGSSSDDPSAGGDPSGGGDTGGDTGGGDTGDTSTESLRRLAVTSGSSTTGAADVPAGCFACTMGCRSATPDGSMGAGRQAIGASDASSEQACRAAVRSLAQWSHVTYRQRLATCQRVDVVPSSAGSRASATPSVAPARPARARSPAQLRR